MVGVVPGRHSVPPRILILVENLPVPFDRRVWMEACALRDAGFGISVICPRGDGAYRSLYDEREEIRIYRYPLKSRSGLAGHLWEYFAALLCTFALTGVVWLRDGFDAIQSANPPDFFFPIGGLFKLLGKPFVFDHHDLVPETCETRWTGEKLRVMRWMSLVAERATFWTADRVISTNESYRQVAILRGGVSSERVVVVRSAPRMDRFCRVPPDDAHKRGRPYLVVYLGVMGPNDGLDLLISAIRHVVHVRGRQDIQFTLIGTGDMWPMLVRQCDEADIADYVHFTGRIPDDAVLSLLSTADVGVAPDPLDALNDVSTMNKIIEYMALGLPVVAFDLREARVSAQDAAAYARPNHIDDFGDVILDVLASPEMRRQMASAGLRRFREELAWEHQRERLIAMYSDLLSQQPTDALPDRAARPWLSR